MGFLSIHSFLALLTLISSASAQQVTLISNTLPACAQSCPVLIQAQSACVPPPLGAAVVSNQQTYTSCFCQSSYLTPLKAGTGTSVCPTCSTADMSTTQQWYNGLCAVPNGAAVPGANGQPTTTTSPATTTTPTPVAPSTPTPTGARTAGGVTQDTSGSNKSWISTHYRWVIMLIVLFLGLGALAIAGTWFHRRRQRRQELGGHDRTGQPDLGSWGPGQSVHEFGAPGAVGVAGAASEVAQNEKGKSRGMVAEQAPEKTRGSRRLRKVPFLSHA